MTDRAGSDHLDHPGSTPVTVTAIDSTQFRHVLGHYPTGVAAITARSAQGLPIGMVVGTFTSVSLAPPLVGFLPDRNSSTWPLVEETGRFCVNLLAADQQGACRQLSAKSSDKFAGLKLGTTMNGLPVIDGAIAHLDCTLYSVTEAGDHWFVLGEVVAMEVMRDSLPLLFHRGKYGAFAETN
jgi:3-hydroxy-9,10-secoandrosta-1,3,5(10)-triene-9,17-dione monooxygenase reductase component